MTKPRKPATISERVDAIEALVLAMRDVLTVTLNENAHQLVGGKEWVDDSTARLWKPKRRASARRTKKEARRGKD